MIIKILFYLLGVFLFLFIFWKKLKDDYIANQIFGSAFLVVFAVLLTSILSTKFYPQLWFWGNCLAVTLAFTLSHLRFKFKTLELFEVLTVSLLPWFALFFLADGVASGRTSSYLGFIVIFLFAYLFFVLEKHYKRFAWYKSGRIGFTGLTTLGFLFLFRTAVAVTGFDVLSFGVSWDALASGIVAFICFLIVYNLAKT